MNEQFPAEIENRRVKKAKQAKDENAECRLVVDKLFINNVHYADPDGKRRMNIFSSDDDPRIPMLNPLQSILHSMN